MKLWIDDVRPAPEGWTWVKSFDEAVETFQANAVSDASFDHDLGFVLPEANCNFDVDLIVADKPYDGNLPTGYDLIKWVVENDKWPETCAVHSMNPTGFRNICSVIERYGPYTYREAIIYSGPNNYQLHGVRYS